MAFHNFYCAENIDMMDAFIYTEQLEQYSSLTFMLFLYVQVCIFGLLKE
jgi:hypothetical protein